MSSLNKPQWFNLEFWFLIALALLALNFIRGSRELNPTAAVFPYWIALVAIIFIGLRIFSMVYRGYKPREEEPSKEEAEIPAEFVPEIKVGEKGVVEIPAKPMKWIYTLMLMIAFFAAIQVLGFTVASLIYLTGVSYLMGYRRIRVILLFSIIMTFFLVITLSSFFQIPIPEGMVIKYIRGY